MSNVDNKIEIMFEDRNKLDKAAKNALDEIGRISKAYINNSNDLNVKSLSNTFNKLTKTFINRLKIIMNKIKSYIDRIFSVVLNENAVLDNIKKYTKSILGKLKEIIDIFLLKPLSKAYDSIKNEIKKLKIVKSSALAIIGYFGYDLIAHLNGYIVYFLKPFIKKYTGINDPNKLNEFIDSLMGWTRTPVVEELYKYGITKLTGSEIPATVTFLREQKYYFNKYGKKVYQTGGSKALFSFAYKRLAAQAFHSKTIHDYKETGAKNLTFNMALHSFWNSFVGDLLYKIEVGIAKATFYSVKYTKRFLRQMEFIPKRYTYRRGGKIIYKGITRRELKRIDPEMYKRLYGG